MLGIAFFFEAALRRCNILCSGLAAGGDGGGIDYEQPQSWRAISTVPFGKKGHNGVAFCGFLGAALCA